MSEASEAGGQARGKVVVVGLVGLILAAMGAVGAVGYHHATRNKRRHQPGELNGSQLYGSYCARCHGPAGQGIDAYPGLLRPDLDEAAFLLQVQNGKERMPAFKDFDPQDYRLLWEHVQGLRGAAR